MTAAPGRGLLRILTCGSVDDGKSTLIGRLLFDAGLLADDTLSRLAADSRRHGTAGAGEVDLALLVDGLEAEREQGITIDVAHRFFATPRRSFIVADTPGHEQYTRNMATGASNSDLAVILVDSRRGLAAQTRRHTYICSLFGIRHAVLAVNKIDLVGFSADAFGRIAAEWRAFATGLGFRTALALPVSARHGDNVVRRSDRMPWHEGPSLLEYLEEVEPADEAASRPLRLPVQWVNRPDDGFRGYCGRIASGRLAAGDRVVIAASGRSSRVARLLGPDGDVAAATAGDAVTVCLADELDVGRGDVLAHPDAAPILADQFAAHLLWMDEEPMLPGRQYVMRIGHLWTGASVTSIRHRIDTDTLEDHAARRLELNQIGVCNLTVGRRVPLDPYADLPATGGFILVDRFTNRTVAAGIVDHSLSRATNIHRESYPVDKAARAALLGQSPAVLWFTGLSGSGKSTIAKAVERRLHAAGRLTYTLDGDNLRLGMNRDLGFTDADRVENIRRAGEIARLFVDAGVIVLCSFISPFRAERRSVRDLFAEGEFVEIFVDTPIEECIRRDPKGLYEKARSGRLANFTGISSGYEAPELADLHLRTSETGPDALADIVVRHVAGRQARRDPA